MLTISPGDKIKILDFSKNHKRKYSSVEAVLEAYSGHKGQTKNEIILLNEAYGWDRFDGGKVSKDTLPEEKSKEDTAVDTARQPIDDIVLEMREFHIIVAISWRLLISLTGVLLDSSGEMGDGYYIQKLLGSLYWRCSME